MQYCFLQCQTLLSSPDRCTTGHHLCFCSDSSFLLRLFLSFSLVVYWAPTDLGGSSFCVISFCLFILSGLISPLNSSSILGTYRPGEFIFQCPIFLPFHTVHGVLKARILKSFAILFSSGPHSVRTLHHDPLVLGGPTWHGS